MRRYLFGSTHRELALYTFVVFIVTIYTSKKTVASFIETVLIYFITIPGLVLVPCTSTTLLDQSNAKKVTCPRVFVMKLVERRNAGKVGKFIREIGPGFSHGGGDHEQKLAALL